MSEGDFAGTRSDWLAAIVIRGIASARNGGFARVAGDEPDDFVGIAVKTWGLLSAPADSMASDAGNRGTDDSVAASRGAVLEKEIGSFDQVANDMFTIATQPQIDSSSRTRLKRDISDVITDV